MQSRRTILILSICVVVLLTVVGLRKRPNEPVYQGHRLSYWVDHYIATIPPQQVDSRAALLAIGTNAVPWLIQWIQYEPPPRLPQVVVKILPQSFWATRTGDWLAGNRPQGTRAMLALNIFGLLGTNAASAIPDLVALMKDRHHPATTVNAILALSHFSQLGFPALAEALSDKNQPARGTIATMLLALAQDPAVGTDKVLPLLIKASEDPDLDTRLSAQKCLVQLRTWECSHTPVP